MNLNEQNLLWTFEYLCSKKLYYGYTKCIFVQSKVEYLGHIIGSGVIAVNPAKTYTIMNWP